MAVTATVAMAAITNYYGNHAMVILTIVTVLVTVTIKLTVYMQMAVSRARCLR